MSEEIPIWVNGIIQWVSGVDRKTTCRDVIEAVLLGEGNDRHNVKDYTIMERWRRVERPLDENSKILKIWSHWGDEKKEVRFCLKRINNEIDSGRGSPIGVGSTPSLKRRRHHRSRGSGKPPWGHHETLHPKRLAELGELNKEEYEEYQSRRQSDAYDDRSENGYEQLIYDSRHCMFGEKIYGRKPEDRKKSGHKSYQCEGVLHSTLLPGDDKECCKPSTSKCCSKRQPKSKIRNSENIEKLMKLILAQGATIQSQLQKLKEREEQIESLEHERHRERVEKNGRNYLLETYLGSLNEAEIPVTEEERGNDSGVNTEGGSDQTKEERLQKPMEDETQKTVAQRTKRSRSESRSREGEEKENCLKRTLSDNALADDTREGEEEGDDLVELRRIQSQVEMWEKVFKINKKLEREEENLVRLHIKIKRFQAESVKFAKDDAQGSQEDGTVERVQKDLETLREDLDQNSKEIYQNFTKLKENDEVVEEKRTILNSLMNDLEETEHEHNLLSEMVCAMPEEQEARTSFSEETVTAPEIVPIRLYNRSEIPPNQREVAKPKIVKISFDNQVREKTDNHKDRTQTPIKGILKNRNASDQCEEWGVSDRRTAPYDPYPSEYVPSPLYEPYPRINSGDVKQVIYNKTSTPERNVYGNRNMMTARTILNDTDSSTSSDTSGMCSMYSSSPTAEEPYVEPTYVLDTLV